MAGFLADDPLPASGGELEIMRFDRDPRDRALDAVVDGAYEESVGGLIGRAAQDWITSGGRALGVIEPARMLTAEEANDRYGIEEVLTFDKPVAENRAGELWGIKQRELMRGDALERSSTVDFWDTLGAGVLGSLYDPVTLGTSFFGFGELSMLRSAMPGLAALEQSSNFGARLLGRGGFGAIGGAGSAGVFELAAFPLARYREQRDYTLWDSLANIAISGGLGGIGGLMSPGVPGDVQRADIHTRDRAFATAVGNIAGGEGVDVGPVFGRESAPAMPDPFSVAPEPEKPAPPAAKAPGWAAPAKPERAPEIETIAQEIEQARRAARWGEGQGDFAGYVARQGGIRDDRGDILKMAGDRKTAKKLLRADGLSIDDMANKAWEDGWFDTPERPSVNDFLDALDGDVRVTRGVGDPDERAAARDVLRAWEASGVDLKLSGERLRADIEAKQAHFFFDNPDAGDIQQVERQVREAIEATGRYDDEAAGASARIMGAAYEGFTRHYGVSADEFIEALPRITGGAAAADDAIAFDQRRLSDSLFRGDQEQADAAAREAGRDELGVRRNHDPASAQEMASMLAAAGECAARTALQATARVAEVVGVTTAGAAATGGILWNDLNWRIDEEIAEASRQREYETDFANFRPGAMSERDKLDYWEKNAPNYLAARRRTELEALPEDATIETIADKVAELSGVKSEFLQQLVRHESGGDPNAAAATSSARGLTQFVDDTWESEERRSGALWGKPPGDQRFDPRWAMAMGAAHSRHNAEALEDALGRRVTFGEVYLAHFMGLDGAVQLIRAAQDGVSYAAGLFPAAAEANRNVFYDGDRPRSAREVVELQTRDFSDERF